MSKGLDALNKLEQTARGYCGEYAITFDDIDRGIFKDDAKAIETIRRELKAFEIIKEKRVDTRVLLLVDSLYKYNNFDVIKRIELTQDEFDLLKEELK